MTDRTATDDRVTRAGRRAWAVATRFAALVIAAAARHDLSRADARPRRAADE